MPRALPLSLALLALPAFAPSQGKTDGYQPKVEGASPEAARALGRFEHPADLTVELFAAELDSYDEATVIALQENEAALELVQQHLDRGGAAVAENVSVLRTTPAIWP